MKPSPTRVRFAVLGFAASLSLLTYLDRVCISQVRDQIEGDLGITEKQMGWVFSAFLFGYMLFEVPGGWMGDRWGTRRVLTRIVLWWSLFTALTGCVTQNGLFFITGVSGFAMLLIIRFLFGAGEAGAYPNLARVVGCWFPYRERALAQGTIWMSARLGGAIAPIAIIELSDWIGWRGAFGVLGSIGIVWVISFRLWFRNRPEDHPHCNEAERDLIRSAPHSLSSSEAGQAHAPVPWRTMLTSGNMWAVCLAAACVSFGWYFYASWQPQFLKDVHGIDFKESKWLTALPWLAGAAGCLLGGFLSDRLVRRAGRRWGRSLLGLVGFTGAGLCVLAIPAVPEAWQAVTLLCLAFFINDVAIPVLWAVGSDIGGRHAGTVTGFMNMIGAVGGMISPTLTPILKYDLPETMSLTARWQIIFAVYATAWFIAALAWLWIDASKPLFRDSES